MGQLSNFSAAFSYAFAASQVSIVLLLDCLLALLAAGTRATIC